MSNAINQHPEIASTPEGQKQIAQIYGKEHAPIVTGFLQTAAHLKQQATDQYKMAANTKIAPAYNPQGVKLPDSPEAIQHEIQLIQGSIDNEALPKNLHEAGKAHIEALQKEYDRLQGAQLKTSDELAREGRAPGVEAAKTRARIGEETSPEAIAGASKKSAATSAAATSARENVENSDAVINKKIDAAVRTEKAKAEAAGTKPQTPAEQEKAKNALVTRAKNLSALYTQEHGSGPWVSGKQEFKEERAKWFFNHDPEVAVTLDLAPSTGATSQPDGNYDLNGKHLYAYKGQVYDLGSVTK